MLLNDLLRERLTDPCVPLAANTVSHYDRCIRQYGEHLGHLPRLEDLDGHLLLGWGRATVGAGLSPHTANQRIKQLRALWQWAYETQIVQTHPPRRLKVKAPRVVPDSWSDAELQRLFDAAAAMSGWIGPHRASDFWLGALWYGWNTGARSAEIWALEPSMIDLDAAQADVPARIRKGGEVAMRWWLTPRCVDALGRVLARSEELVWVRPWANNCSAAHHFAGLLARAGLPRHRRNGVQKIRRTVATRIKIRGGDPAVWLGHAPKTVAEESYTDRWAVQTALRNVWPVDTIETG